MLLFSQGSSRRGRFRQHTWYEDRFWDVIRLALYREAWPELRQRAQLVFDVAEDAAELLAEQEALRQAQGDAQGDGASEAQG